MSRIFAAACALALLGPAAFAQNTMGNGMSNGAASTMSNGSMGTKPSDTMKPLENKAKPATGNGMSNSMAPSGNTMAPQNNMAPGNNMGNSTSTP